MGSDGWRDWRSAARGGRTPTRAGVCRFAGRGCQGAGVVTRVRGSGQTGGGTGEPGRGSAGPARGHAGSGGGVGSWVPEKAPLCSAHPFARDGQRRRLSPREAEHGASTIPRDRAAAPGRPRSPLTILTAWRRPVSSQLCLPSAPPWLGGAQPRPWLALGRRPLAASTVVPSGRMQSLAGGLGSVPFMSSTVSGMPSPSLSTRSLWSAASADCVVLCRARGAPGRTIRDEIRDGAEGLGGPVVLWVVAPQAAPP
jgi:hypothetical protein